MIFGSNRFFFSLHLFLCGHVFVLALMGCWCYHMIFHLASSLWLAWLQSLSNSCSLLTTRFFILFFPPGFPFYPFTLVFLFYFICLFIFEIKLLKTQLANERNEGDLGWIWVLRTDLLVMPLLCISLRILWGLKRMTALWRDEDIIQKRNVVCRQTGR